MGRTKSGAAKDRPARAWSAKAGKGKSYLPAGDPRRTHDANGPRYKVRQRRVTENWIRWFMGHGFSEDEAKSLTQRTMAHGGLSVSTKKQISSRRQSEGLPETEVA